MKTKLATLGLVVSGLWAYAMPSTAQACGGTFCDAGPQSMPVDQTGEVVLFVMGENETEAHIKIQYDPDTEASKFAWVIPVTEVPEFSVGSDVLFDRLLGGSVPSYGFTRTFDSCGDDDGAGGLDGGGSGGDGGDESGGGETGGGGPEIVLQETVGAFDITLLSGGTAAEVIDWLDANGYEQDPEAEPIFDEYLADNYLFAALKLTNGADTDEIHPITLTFPNDEACVPLRLTRIAAVDDMDIRTLFLSDNRVVPETYKHVLVNPLMIDWPNLGANYKELITLAVDADQANGRAFVTEYAGPSDVIDVFGIYSTTWRSSAFAAIDPVDVVDELVSQGLMTCYDVGGSDGGSGGASSSECQYNHPLLRGLLGQWLPVPDTLDEIDFYGCLTCYEGLIDTDAWNAAEFTQAFDERIVAPGQHALELLGSWPYLTRMYTTISPAEMTEDPFFHENPDLADVDLRNEIATQRTLCNGANVWILPDGREVYVPASTWPTFGGEMPWEEEVTEIGAAGAPIVLTDRHEEIAVKLEMHNCTYDYPTPEACGKPGGGDDFGDDGSETGAGGTGVGDDEFPGNETGMPTGGCGCSTDNRAGGLLFGLFGFGLFAATSQRRRRRRG